MVTPSINSMGPKDLGNILLMRNEFLRKNVFLLFAFLLTGWPSLRAETDVSTLTFEEHIRPILRTYCLDCHGGEAKLEGNLDLRLVRFQLKGGDSGPAIVPGDPVKSHLLERVRAAEMPPGEAKMPATEQALLEKWIAAGAKTKSVEPETLPPGIGISDEERRWWAFQPIKRPEVPVISSIEAVRTPVDAFLRQAMPKWVDFSPEASPLTLIKRAAFDLTGLPPTTEEIDRFTTDTSPDSFDRLLDRLLASPSYGERWSRHWLDVAGYADSEGGTADDAARPWAYKYRDYVIRAFNGDKPFDRFIEEQLAGDELAGPIQGDMSPEQIELLTATGYLRMAADGTGSGANTPEARNQVIADTLKIVSNSLMGVTVACAQCHDHRYDPILQKDYFALRAVIEPALDWNDWKPPQARLVSLYTEANRKQANEIEAEVQKIAAEREAKQTEYIAAATVKELEKYPAPLRDQLKGALDTPADKRTAEQKQLLDQNPSANISPGVLYQYNQGAADDLKKYDAKMGEMRAKKPAEEFLHALVEPANHVVETHRFHRGDYRQPLEVVAPGMFTVLSDVAQPIVFPNKSEGLPSTGRRSALAHWLTGPDNPLTSRVLANRFWMHHFGRGLVGTPTDFGKLGNQPTHPALLDWLASELEQDGWSIKQFHRVVMSSTVYRQSAKREVNRASFDTENKYYARQNVTRLDAETLRDRIIAASGEIDQSMFGPAVAVKADETGQVIIDENGHRRTIYTQQRRSQPVALLQAFDAPVMQTNCEARPSSTVATQSLMLMNGDFLLQQAFQLARRMTVGPQQTAPSEITEGLSPIGGDSIPPLWQFGYGPCELKDGKVDFHQLPHWTGTAWQGGAALPDRTLDWVHLHARGGHPGASPDHCAIRRWNSPTNGRVVISGKLSHGSENGDGVRGRIVSSRSGTVGEWTVQHGAIDTNAENVSVEAGDHIDFITDGREHVTSDSFEWDVNVTLTHDAETSGEGNVLTNASDAISTATWNSSAGFHGPLATRAPIEPAALVNVWQSCYQRMPTKEELTNASKFVRDSVKYLNAHPERIAADRSPELQSLTNLAQVLMSSNEFLYVD